MGSPEYVQSSTPSFHNLHNIEACMHACIYAYVYAYAYAYVYACVRVYADVDAFTYIRLSDRVCAYLRVLVSETQCTLNRKPEILSPKSVALNPKSPNPKPQTLSPKPQTLNPIAERHSDQTAMQRS